MKANVQPGCVSPLLREGETQVLLVLEQASGLAPVKWAVSCHGLSLGCPKHHLFDDNILLLSTENCGSVCGVHGDFSGLTFRSKCSGYTAIIEKELVLVWGR